MMDWNYKPELTLLPNSRLLVLFISLPEMGTLTDAARLAGKEPKGLAMVHHGDIGSLTMNGSHGKVQ